MDMRMFGFGSPRPDGNGVIADYSLHLQCPWRFKGATGTIVASSDLYRYAGPGDEPEGWSYEDGHSLQASALEELLGKRIALGKQYCYRSGLIVTAVRTRPLTGDLAVDFVTGHTLSVFALSAKEEQWRLFTPDGDGDHLVYGG